MANNKPTMVTTGEVRISYEHLMKPYANQQGAEPKFSATLLIPKSDVATKQRIDAAIQAATQEGINSKWNGVRPPQVAIPIYDGDGVRPNGEPFRPECKGHWVMTASSRIRPEVVDLNLNPIIDATEVYSGMYARVNINFFPYNATGKKGIGCGLGPVQKTRDGEPLGGRITAAEAFGGGAPDYPAQPTAQTGYSQQTYQQPPYSAQPQYPVQPQYQQPQYSAVDPITGQPMNPQSPPVLRG